MAKFCNPLLGLVCMSGLVCILFIDIQVQSLPTDNELKDNGYLGLTKTMPRRVLSFGMDMQKNLIQEKPEENVLTSPISAYAALMMLHLGAGDQTRQELNEVLKVGKDELADPEKFHETFGEILRNIEHRHEVATDDTPEAIITNGFFVQQDRHIRDSYLQSLHKYYNGTATNVDFAEHAGTATDTINSWVSESTKHRIEKLYETPLPSTTVSVLTSAIYFQGVWKDTFEKEHTHEEKFHTGNSDVDVHMMRNTKRVLYSYSDILQFESIELPYKGDEYVMTIQLPRPSQTLKNMTEHVHLLDVKELNRNTKTVGVDYKVPKMKISWKNSLVNALGLEDIFRRADLSRMSETKTPVSAMIQATEMEVDEHGTVATAATAISGTRRLTPPVNAEKTFYVDRPFSVAIVHKPTQMILFYANIYKPY